MKLPNTRPFQINITGKVKGAALQKKTKKNPNSLTFLCFFSPVNEAKSQNREK